LKEEQRDAGRGDHLRIWRSASGGPTHHGNKIVLDGSYVKSGTPAGYAIFRGHQLIWKWRFPEKNVFLPLRFSVAEEQGRFNISHLGIGRLNRDHTVRGGAELDNSLPAFQFTAPTTSAGGRSWTHYQTAVVAPTGNGQDLFSRLALCC
jgi:hypothetical protein